MKLKNLFLHRLPGFKHRGFSLENLSEGINIIAGPNASGKTSICNAIEKLLWPNKKKDFNPISIDSEWTCHQSLFNLSMEDGIRSVSQEGLNYVDSLPSEHLSGCFNITIDDLFDGKDQEFADKISQELAGGYDIESAQTKLTPSNNARSTIRDWKIAKEKFDEYIKDQKNVENEKNLIPRLEKTIADSKKSKDRSVKLGKIIDAKILRNNIAKKQDFIASFPKQLIDNKITSHDWEHYLQLEEKQKQILSTISELRLQEKQLIDKLKNRQEIPLIDDNELELQAERICRMKKIIDDQSHRLNPQKEKLLRDLELYLNFFHLDKDFDLKNIHVEHLDLLDEKWAELENIKSKIFGIEEQIILNEAPECELSENILNEIKSTFELTFLRQKKWFRLWISILMASGSCFALTWFLNEKMRLLAVIPIIPIVCLILDLNFFYRKNKLKNVNIKKNLSYLKLLGENFAKSKFYEIQNIEKNKLESKLKKELLLKRSIEEELDKATLLLGLNPLNKDSRYRFAEYYKQLIKTWLEYQTVNQELVQTETILSKEWEEWNLFAKLFSEEHVSSVYELSIVLDRIKNKIISCFQLRKINSDSLQLEKQLEEVNHKINELLNKTGCLQSPNTLKTLVNKLSDFEKENQELRNLMSNFEIITFELDAEDILKIDESLDLIKEEKKEEEEKACQYGALCEDLGRLKNQIEQMESSIEGQKLLSEKNSKFDEVKKSARAFAEKELLDLIISETQAEFTLNCQPLILRKAAEWFQYFTKNTFQLETPKNSEAGTISFEAVKTSTRERKSLEQLSRGTRIQLLMAVRLSFAMNSQKQGILPPILFDEILANTDPERFDAIVDILNELSKHNKQIFYFTCNPQDVYKWQTRNSEINIIDLAKIQKQQTFLLSPMPSVSLLDNLIPKPTSDCIDAYAIELKIPSLNLHDPFESTSCYYLVETADQLYKLVSNGIHNLGNLQSIKNEIIENILPGYSSSIFRRLILLKEFYKLRKQGKGSPFPKSSFNKVGVSKKWHESFLSIADEFSYNAKTFIKVFENREDPRIKGLKRATIEDLKAFFIENEHLDERKILTDDEIRRSLIEFIEIEEDQNFIEKLLKHTTI